MKNLKRRSECPISSSLDIWGDKWSLLIVRDLMFSKQCTYGDFLKSDEKIATNILAARLLMLEENGIISKWMCLVMGGMDKMIGKDFEAGLKSLKEKDKKKNKTIAVLRLIFVSRDLHIIFIGLDFYSKLLKNFI